MNTHQTEQSNKRAVACHITEHANYTRSNNNLTHTHTHTYIYIFKRMLPELLPPLSAKESGEDDEEEEEEPRRRASRLNEAPLLMEIEFDESPFLSPRETVKNIIDIETKMKKMKSRERGRRGESASGGGGGDSAPRGGRRDEDGTTTTTTTKTMREKYNRLLLKHQALKRDFRKLSEDYDYNFALFKERDEELDSLEEQLSVEKKKNRAYRDRIKELEREVALRTL